MFSLSLLKIEILVSAVSVGQVPLAIAKFDDFTEFLERNLNVNSMDAIYINKMRTYESKIKVTSVAAPPADPEATDNDEAAKPVLSKRKRNFKSSSAQDRLRILALGLGAVVLGVSAAWAFLRLTRKSK